MTTNKERLVETLGLKVCSILGATRFPGSSSTRAAPPTHDAPRPFPHPLALCAPPTILALRPPLAPTPGGARVSSAIKLLRSIPGPSERPFEAALSVLHCPGAMAQAMVSNRQVKHVTEDPNRLWIWDKATYVDEHQRTWLPVILKV